MPTPTPRKVCFVTGTRAEFGLMATTLRAIQSSQLLRLQIAVTGMHLDRAHGQGLRAIAAAGWKVDRVIPWPRGIEPTKTAIATGRAMAALAQAFADFSSDIVLVVGDRVEAFAAASAAAISGRIVAHVHGGDRAQGQVDDSLRHAITKLAHVHFPATPGSARRLRRLGEEAWRIHRVGSPGIDGILTDAAPQREALAQFPEIQPRRFALLALHPTSGDPEIERRRADMILRALGRSALPCTIIIGPNNDPGCDGILRRFQAIKPQNSITYRPDLARPLFLALVRDAAFVIGNSSSGIIEGASFGTPVIDIGDRQKGREHGDNVAHVPFQLTAIRQAIATLWRGGNPIRFPRRNNRYEGRGAGPRIANVLQSTAINDRLRRKLISY
jgi:UDP-N-acetylglucosamine 2-epimerase (non-hydrolysing)/GDP/UDP-N,N'-diacetylbacillosamine 2-epimerase (hydrolysing)